MWGAPFSIPTKSLRFFSGRIRLCGGGRQDLCTEESEEREWRWDMPLRIVSWGRT